MYDCIDYDVTVASLGVAMAPWCFTADGTGASTQCKPLTCSQGVQRACPAGAPPADGPAAGLAGWAAAPCVEALCGARAALANLTACASDAAADRSALQAAFVTLNASSAYPAALSAAASAAAAGSDSLNLTSATSLTARCDMQYGQMCVDDVISALCPAIFRSNNYWMVRTKPEFVCDLGCLTALCGLQNRRRNFNATTGTACADADLEMLIRCVCTWRACGSTFVDPWQAAGLAHGTRHVTGRAALLRM